MPNICVLGRRSWENSTEDQRREMRSTDIYSTTAQYIHLKYVIHIFLYSELSNFYHNVVSLRNTSICPLTIPCFVLPTALVIILTNLISTWESLSKLCILYEWGYEQQLHFWISHLIGSFYLMYSFLVSSIAKDISGFNSKTYWSLKVV